MTLGLAARLAESAWLSRIPVKRTDRKQSSAQGRRSLTVLHREDLTLVMKSLDSSGPIQPKAFV